MFGTIRNLYKDYLALGGCPNALSRYISVSSLDKRCDLPSELSEEYLAQARKQAFLLISLVGIKQWQQYVMPT
jgi:hypothetical protein